MTYSQAEKVESSQEFIVTPEMVEAGVRAFWELYPEAVGGNFDRDMVKSVLGAALSQGGRAGCRSGSKAP